MQDKRLQHFVLSAIVLSAVSLFDVTSYGQFANEWHVDDDAPAGGNGVDWPNAFNNLENALQEAKLSLGSDLIKVAKGTYVPTDEQIPGDTRSVTFHLDQDMDITTIKGGYHGFDQGFPDRRDPRRFETILSGDITGDDLPGFVNNGENAYHVLTYTGFTTQIVINGFHIVGGNANVGVGNGGGAVVSSAFTSFVNCTFLDNFALRGGALAIDELGPEAFVVNCRFFGNQAQLQGGAIKVSDRFADCVNCIFSGNSVINGNGGAIYAPDSLGFEGGAFFLTNCSLSGNSADNGSGGAIFIQSSFASLSSIDNSIIWGNSPDQIDDNSATGTPVNYSNVEGGWIGPGGNNINVNPLFLDPDGGDNDLGTDDDNLRLLPTSLSIDTANPDVSVIPDDVFDVDDDTVTIGQKTPDRDLKPRVVAVPDMGSYECRVQTVCPPDVTGDCNVGINDFLAVLGQWGQVSSPATDFVPACGDGDVGIQEFLAVLANWGSCPACSLPPDPPIEEAVEEAGLTEDDWDDFVDVMTDPEGDPAVQANHACWMEHYLDCHRRPHCFECACQICPDSDPWNHPAHP